MGTYTTNKNLFMPTVGETGWGALVNENFSTIDTFLKPITESDGTYTFTGNLMGNVTGDVTGNLNGIITKNATVVTSEPYGYNNIILGSIPSFNSASKTVTISAIPATATTPWGTYTITRPSFTITYTATYIAGAGTETVTITHNGTQVLHHYFVYNSNTPATFSITYNTATISTLVCNGYGNVTIKPDITTLYLNCT